MTSSSAGKNWTCTHCGHHHADRPFSIDNQFQCQSCSQWFSATSPLPPPIIEPPLELLDDQELFQSLDLTGIDTAANSKNLAFDDQPTPKSQMASVRCRVCDTLQYVELKPGTIPKCEVCFAPFPRNPDGTVTQTKGKGQWTAPSSQTTVRDVSAEAVGGLSRKTESSNDEIDDLIKDVRAEVQADFETPSPSIEHRTNADSSHSRSTDDDELTLQPLEESRGNSREHLYLGEEAHALLFDDHESPIDVDSEALVPWDESPPTVDAILDETPDEEPPVEDPSDIELFVSLNEEDRVLTIPSADGTIDWDSLDPAPLESVPPIPVATPSAPDQNRFKTSAIGPGSSKLPPQFTPPPVITQPPPAARFAGSSFSSDSSATAEQPESATLGPSGISSLPWTEWKDLASPFLSPGLVGVGLALLPLIYWAQLSWRLAIDDNTTFQKLVGYLSILFSSAIVLPVWLAFLGVIANRATSMGQAGRLTSQAIFAQACQFAVVLGCWIPGAAMGTISLHYLVIGCLGALTMLPGGLYLVSSAIVANETFSYNHPKVLRSLKEQTADWTIAAIVSGILLLVGIPMAIATSYAEAIGGIVFALFVVPASMIYAATIGCLAKRILQLDDDEPKARKW
jgi:hypothetical protein